MKNKTKSKSNVKSKTTKEYKLLTVRLKELEKRVTLLENLLNLHLDFKG